MGFGKIRTRPRHEHPAITQRINRAAVRAMVPEERLAKFDADFPESKLLPLPKQRNKVVRPVDGKPDVPLERDVLSAVGDLLYMHPDVALAVRQNSGSMTYESHGRHVPVWFYKLCKKPGDVTITDYWGFMRDGRPFAIECKRATWQRVTDKREERQRAFIEYIKSIGGVGGFARSADEAKEILQFKPGQL